MQVATQPYPRRPQGGSDYNRHEFTERTYAYENGGRGGGRRGESKPTFCGSCAGAAVGVILLLVGTTLLWYNEGDAVKGQQKLLEAHAALAAPEKGRGLTHLTGMLTAKKRELTDTAFDIAAQSIRLERSVEVFLWKEHKDVSKRKVPDGRGGEVTETTTKYRYTSGWESKGVDSGLFKNQDGHRNPSWADALANAAANAGLEFGPNTWNQPRVELEGLALGKALLEQAVRMQPLSLDVGRVKAAVKESGRAVVDGTHVYSAAKCVPPRDPAVGCARLTWRHAPLEEVSVLAKKQASELVPWASGAGSGYDVAMLSFGEVHPSTMLEAASSAQTVMTWLKRGGGSLLMWAGWALLFGPAQYLASWIPLLSGMVGCVLSMIALGAAIAHSLIVIAIAWVAHRPLLAFTLFVGAACSLAAGYGALRSSKKSSSSSSRTGHDEKGY